MANYRGHSGRLFCTQWSMTDPDVIYTGADDFSVHAWRISQQEYIVPPKGQLVNFCRIFLPPANDVCEGYVFTHVWHSVQGGSYPSMHCRWYPSMPCSRSLGGGWYPSMPCKFPGPHPWGKLRGLAGVGGLQAQTWGGLQVHTWVVSWPTPGGGSPGPHPRGVSRPTPGGCIPACTEADPHPPTATAAGGTHPTGMHSCCSISSGQMSIKDIDTVVMYPL